MDAIGASRRKTISDVLSVLASIVIGSVMMSLPEPILRPYGGLTVVMLSALSLSLLLRRRVPVALAWLNVAVVAAVLVAELVSPGVLIPPNLSPSFLPWVPPFTPFVVYALVVYAGRRMAAWPPAILLLLLATRPWAGPSEHITQGLVLIAGPALLGMYVSARRRLIQSLVERAERVEREQVLRERQARADERTRLAAEMHNVVTHRVSLMVLQAGTLSLTAREEHVRAGAEDLRETGCLALAELRDLVGLLRMASPSAGEPVAAQPEQAPAPPLEPLLAESESVGVPIELIQEGDPTRASPVVGRAVYRVVQEALTNVRKHAPGAPVQVRLSYTTQDVHVSVSNAEPSHSCDSALVEAGSGTGLLGLRQRVELLGGTFSAGPRDRGFHVDALLPAHLLTGETAPTW
ncbi:sensor histidine kinase [Actinoplanes sp. NPDC004185]